MAQTDMQHSSTDDSVDGRYSVPSMSRREPSDDYGATSKFVEAMKNPNWRRRHDDNGSSASTQTESSSCEIIVTRKQGVERSHQLATVSSDYQSSVDDTSWEHVINASDWNMARKDQENSHDYSVISAVEDTLKIEENFTSGICGVVKHTEFADLQPNDIPMSFIEVMPLPTPLSSTTNYLDSKMHLSFPDFVEIRRIQNPKQKLQKATSSCQESQLAAALQVAEKTPRKVGFTSPENQPFKRPRVTTRLEKAQNAVFDDPAVADMGGVYRDDKLDGRYHNNQPRFDKRKENNTKSPEPKEPAFKDSAFQKMLLKLYKGANVLRGPVDEPCQPNRRPQ